MLKYRGMKFQAVLIKLTKLTLHQKLCHFYAPPDIIVHYALNTSHMAVSYSKGT